MADLLPQLFGDEVDRTELVWVIRGECGSAIQPNSREIWCSPTQVQDGYALCLRLSNEDELIGVEPGSLCTPDLITRLRERVRTALVEVGPTQIFTKIIFASNCLRAWYRYRNRCQLLPMLPDASQPRGPAPEFPCRLELAVPTSTDQIITTLRVDREARRWELLLCGMVGGGIHQLRGNRMHWVLTGPGQSSHLQELYASLSFAVRGDFLQISSVRRR